MAESRTQDNQKVFNSATAGFQSFLNGVSPNSSTKNMELIYQNMEKLFDVFTQGVLLEQGANSEYILRTIYRSLGEDFLDIFQNSQAVDKIVEVLKQKQSSIEPSEVDKALVSETTKKVITKTLDPNDCDPLSVVIDFTDEIQQAVLQVKLNLSREYERKKIEYARSYQGQQEDFEKLKEQFQEQDNEISSKLKELGMQDEQWRIAQIESTKKLLEAFKSSKTTQLDESVVSDNGYANIGDISKLIDEKQLNEIAKQQANKFKVKNILTKIRKPSVKVISKTTVIEKTNVIDNQTVQIYQPEVPKKIPRKEDASKDNNVEVIENPKIVEPKDAGDKIIDEPQKSTDKVQLDSHHQTHASDDRGLVKQVGKVVLDKEQSPEEKDQKLENLARKKIVQDVVDGKIKTPIPTEAVKPMLQGEQVLKDKFEKLEESSIGKSVGFENPMKNQETLGDLENDVSNNESIQEEPKVDVTNEKETDGTKIQVSPKVTSIQKQDNSKQVQEQGTKLEWKLLPDGRKQCPFCYTIFDKDNNPINGEQPPDSIDTKLATRAEVPKPLKKDKKEEDNKETGSKITEQGVVSNIGKFNEGTASLIKDEKFKQNFLLDYKPVQKQVQKQMGMIDKQEIDTKKDLSETEKGIKDLKKGKGSFLSKLLFGAWKMAFIVVGGILLITLARMAFRAWSNKFMPKSDGSKFKIFGLEIPGLGEIKAFGLGIWNTITVGLPNLWDRVKLFFGKIHKQLFGKKGMFRDAIETRNTLRKIAGAFIIGIAKKVAASGPMGWLWKLLGFLLGLIPGAGPFLQFLCKFVPEIITFISMQIMLHWSNKKANSERELKDLTKKFSSKQLLSNFMAMSKNIKPFVPPRAIPGLEVPKRGNGPAVHGAIMRKTSIGTVGHSKTAKKLQNKLMDKELDEGADADKKRYVYDEKKPNSKWNLLTQAAFTGGEFDGLSEEDAGKNRLRIYNKVIAPQVSKLDAYILYLSKSKRFQNVKGPLYDINTGWNPGYRITQGDLLSPIPLTPFEDMHAKPDVSIGQPGGRSEDWIGSMPFTWEQHGATITANPIKYELERAKKIRELWIDMWHDIEDYGEGSGGLFSDDMESPEEAADQVLKKIIPSYSKKWRQANYVTQGGYGKDVFYGDKFVNFYRKFQKGEIDHNDNNLEGVERANEGGFSKAMKATGKLVGLAALHAGTLGLSTLGILAYKGLKKASENIGRISDYGSGSKLAKSGTIGKVLQTGMSSLKLALWRQTKFHGVSYGDVRDFMLDNGILEWFNQGRILGPIGKAESIVNLLRTKSPSPFSEFSDKNHPWLYSLVWKVLSSHGIKPDSWDRVWDSLDHHKEEQAGFAQSLLEYFGLVVIPSWNKTERMLHNLFSFNGSKEKKEKLKLGLTKQIFRLTKLFTKESIIDFIYDHLRFPNMKVNVIDYSNATDEQRKKIDEYKKKLGIPDKNEKKKILKSLNKDPGDDVEALKQEMLRIGAQLKKAKFEYRFTGGGYEYIQMLQSKLQQAEERYVSALNAKKASQGDSKIVQKPGSIQKVVEPKKTPEQEKKEEEERKKREEERRKAEAEAKRKEEERKKKELEEKKKRAEELAIAKAKIAAMEAIRKQEQRYETILEKMVGDPASVTQEELKSLGDDVNNLKQEAENRINQLPREQRDLKLALIRGDKISDKTFQECKQTAVGLHGSLQNYMDEVNKIPSGSIMAINNNTMPRKNPIQMQDTDEVDMGN